MKKAIILTLVLFLFIGLGTSFATQAVSVHHDCETCSSEIPEYTCPPHEWRITGDYYECIKCGLYGWIY